MLGMIERHGRDHGDKRPVDDVGRVESSPQSHFEQQHVGGMARKKQESRRRRDFKYGDRCARVHALAFAERVGELRVGNEAAFALGAEPKPLVEPHEMRRGIDVHVQPRSRQDRAHESDRRALAVGAGDMDGRRQPPLGISEGRQNAPHSIERQVDALGMQRGEPRNDGVDRSHLFIAGKISNRRVALSPAMRSR